MKYVRRTAGYNWTDYKTNSQIAKKLKTIPILDKLLEYKRSWIQHVNIMPRNRLPRVIKHYSPSGRRNHEIPLKRLLDTWDRNGSTSGPTPWKIYDDINLVINKLNAQILVLNKFIIFLYMFRGLCAHYREVKIVLYSIWYHHTCRWPSGAQVVQPMERMATYRVWYTRCCIVQFWPPDDEHIVLETCRGI